MPVKIDQDTLDDLQVMDLTIWSAVHPRVEMWNDKLQKLTSREDRTRVMVQLNGPGLNDFVPWGYGADLKGAIRHALSHANVIDRVPGVSGAMMRLEAALGALKNTIVYDRWKMGGEQDDEIPF